MLRLSRRVHGEEVSEQGGAIANASITLGQRSRDTLLADGSVGETAPPHEQPTGTDGRASFDSVAPGHVPLLSNAKGMIPSKTFVSLESADEPQTDQQRLRLCQFEDIGMSFMSYLSDAHDPIFDHP
ncbi:MAG: hypothetical protein ACI835_005855 [Planctomycetota bacterium]